ncbi:MAG: mechanosensitive ion channel family protein [Eubacteriales bacterium]|jgi:small conductance mechanosensitive channel|nr:mechanosensitive ion channel family protein [Clostridiales bacterium]
MLDEALNRLGELASEYAVSIAMRLLGAVIIYFIGRKIIKLLRKRLLRLDKLKNSHPTAQSFISSLASFLLSLVLVLTIVSILGLPMTSLLTLLGSAGLSIGLALQGGFSNLTGGIIILMFKPFSIGDFIDDGTNQGTVKEINIFYTELTTPDNRRIIIPNSAISNTTVINNTAEATRRVDISFNVAQDSDLDVVFSLLKGSISEDERILTDVAEPFVAVVGYGAGYLTLEYRVWCKRENFLSLKFDLQRKIPETLAANGIVIARPVFDVTVKNT